MKKTKLKFDKMLFLNILVVVIAILQVIIALPQLKWGYDALTDNDTKRLHNEFVNFRNHNAAITLISIPDSVLNDNIKIVRYYQKEVFLYSSIISQFDYTAQNVENSNDVNLWLEQFKRVYLLLTESITSQEVVMNLDLSSDYKLLKIIYIGPSDYIHFKHTLASFNTDAARFLNSQAVEYADFKKNFPFEKAAKLIKEYDNLNMKFINLLNEYQFKEAYHLVLPNVGEKREHQISISVTTNNDTMRNNKP